MMTLERFEEILNRLNLAHSRAESPDFKAIWLSKTREIQRAELAEIKLNQLEGHIKWQ
jgi:hypothetical protein|tara:strand:- start:124 stop:297 length:174 start_codon:yes stop_codon:yes gene_type:complete